MEEPTGLVSKKAEASVSAINEDSAMVAFTQEQTVSQSEVNFNRVRALLTLFSLFSEQYLCCSAARRHSAHQGAHRIRTGNRNGPG